jgi:cytochrome c biogenesis protein CcdA
MKSRLAERGVWGAAPLGALFALSFCPVSAAFFFGSLLPLALELRSPLLLPLAYGAGTALPVILFAILVAAGARGVGAAFKRLTAVGLWMRRAMAVIFIGVGVYMTLVYSIGLPR